MLVNNANNYFDASIEIKIKKRENKDIFVHE